MLVWANRNYPSSKDASGAVLSSVSNGTSHDELQSTSKILYASHERPSQELSSVHDFNDNSKPIGMTTPASSDKDMLAVHENGLDEEAIDRILPCMPLDQAIMLSIHHGAKGDERKMRDFFGGIIPIGGGAQIPGFNPLLEEELGEAQPRFRKELLVGPPPREIDPQVLVWKGASVFGKLQGTNDSWISSMEYDRLGNRLLAYKCLWNW